MCIRLRETAGPSLHLVPSGAGGLPAVRSSTYRQHCTRASPICFGSNRSGPESKNVAVRQVQRPRVAVMRVMRRQIANRFVARSISIASPNVFERKRILFPSCDQSARSPNDVTRVMCGGNSSTGLRPGAGRTLPAGTASFAPGAL